MTELNEIGYFLRAPKYPVIVDVDGVLVAARSLRPLANRLLPLDLADGQHYDAVDATGESWALIVVAGRAVLSPFHFGRPLTKLQLIRWFNNRQNKPAGEVEYPEKSLSSKKRDRIIGELAERLLDAQKRKPSAAGLSR